MGNVLLNFFLAFSSSSSSIIHFPVSIVVKSPKKMPFTLLVSLSRASLASKVVLALLLTTFSDTNAVRFQKNTHEVRLYPQPINQLLTSRGFMHETKMPSLATCTILHDISIHFLDILKKNVPYMVFAFAPPFTAAL